MSTCAALGCEQEGEYRSVGVLLCFDHAGEVAAGREVSLGGPS